MKLYLLLSLVVFQFCACKKDSTAPKDFATVMKNSVWSGQANVAAKPSQPISMSFADGGQMFWYDVQNAVPGTWKIESGLLIVTLNNGAGFTAKLANDNTLTNIVNLPTTNLSLTTATLNTSPDPVLDNTVWSSSVNNIVIRFKPGNKLDLEIGPMGTTKYTGLSYTVDARTVRFSALSTYKWMLTANGNSSMKGVNVFLPDPTVYTYEVTKQ
ncbi:MAG TPA: hypothetical protein VL307_20100 [Chitinophagaceae bacterium]|nr:hypothetical protein [Chitinophagaceae bacterium]